MLQRPADDARQRRCGPRAADRLKKEPMRLGAAICLWPLLALPSPCFDLALFHYGDSNADRYEDHQYPWMLFNLDDAYGDRPTNK